ncbi:hypothetical protein IHE44_0006946 [Lamprotornis superbus]|uniref:Uncharacterized protein n=1 Tax=Lamprotornis superbus TaxID=245042 RepID=A0A835TZS5_9PASS|nr:hypothetical protein IHE44_0006946 [Lamprotornis superbus]
MGTGPCAKPRSGLRLWRRRMRRRKMRKMPLGGAAAPGGFRRWRIL